MAKENNRKMGRPPTGVGTLIGVRLDKAALKRLDDWRKQNEVGRPEAIRRLLDAALSVSQASPASRMAGQQLDKMADKSATADEQSRRKRRLLEGPEEFRISAQKRRSKRRS